MEKGPEASAGSQEKGHLPAAHVPPGDGAFQREGRPLVLQWVPLGDGGLRVAGSRLAGGLELDVEENVLPLEIRKAVTSPLCLPGVAAVGAPWVWCCLWGEPGFLTAADAGPRCGLSGGSRRH